MADVVDKATGSRMMATQVSGEIRSRMMSGIRGKNTKPELTVRKGLFARGLRYELHRKDLPGKPDLAIKGYKTAIFVHGCFWHQHECALFKWPKSNVEFWRAKIEGNRTRDARNTALLLQLGWRVLIIWECSIKKQTYERVQVILDRAAHWIKGRDVSVFQIATEGVLEVTNDAVCKP
jgi:DNA mismatch endonuclease (patch repair protein)